MRETGFSQDIVRPNIPKIAIFLTDGLSRDEKRTAKEANLTHDAGITVFSIGIGDGIDLIEIRRIASDPDDSFVFQVDDFNSLDSIKDALAIKTCSVKPNDVNEKPAVERGTELILISTSVHQPVLSSLLLQFKKNPKTYFILTYLLIS